MPSSMVSEVPCFHGKVPTAVSKRHAVWALAGTFEHHISGCVALAAWNYFCMTQDRTWLQQEGYPLIEATAEFWLSRIETDSIGQKSHPQCSCSRRMGWECRRWRFHQRSGKDQPSGGSASRSPIELSCRWTLGEGGILFGVFISSPTEQPANTAATMAKPLSKPTLTCLPIRLVSSLTLNR